MIEQRSDHDKRECIAEGKTMVASVHAKNLFGLVPHTVTVGDEMQPGLHVGEKCEGSLKVAPIPKQRHRFADDIPCGAKRRAHRGRFRDKRPSACMVGVFRIETGLARIIHDRFCCNRRSAATTSLRPAGSPLGPTTYCWGLAPFFLAPVPVLGAGQSPPQTAEPVPWAPRAGLGPLPHPSPYYWGGMGGGPTNRHE